jgi:hypothetical protein
MNLVPKEILMSHLKRSEGAEEVSLPIDFFRDLLYQADIQDYKKPWQPLNWGDMPVGQESNFDFMEGARWAEKQLKEKNN